ncbi:MAG TPA: patatin-like phospholipase family protein [Solirubrobacteraceae bacterium]|nr:patatin-like phospholipase family protein [Solirubrobacteraceae bacterium]
MHCYRVLGLDGGGIRGLIPAHVLKEIETHMGRPISEMFDLVAGTSTGGILALGLTKPNEDGKPQFSASDMCELYLTEGTTIFPHSIFQEVKTLHGLADARYPAGPIERILAQRFGETMLSQALAEVVIPSYDVSAPGPYFFKREYAADETEDWDVRMALVARATSAAPTYFDPAVLPSADGRGDHALVDGGTFANNPTLSAYVDALRLKQEIPRVVVVSIGTGLPPQTPGSGPIPIQADEVADFGLVKWARPILEVVLDGVPKAVEYQMQAIQAANPDALGYYRLQSTLPTASHALDDASPENCSKLVADAETLIRENSKTLEQIYAELA